MQAISFWVAGLESSIITHLEVRHFQVRPYSLSLKGNILHKSFFPPFLNHMPLQSNIIHLFSPLFSDQWEHGSINSLGLLLWQSWNRENLQLFCGPSFYYIFIYCYSNNAADQLCFKHACIFISSPVSLVSMTPSGKILLWKGAWPAAAYLL